MTDDARTRCAPDTPPAAGTEEPNDLGENSDEYSDDDDPGYRIVLVEDVGELYPDISYRLRRRSIHHSSGSALPSGAPSGSTSAAVPGGAVPDKHKHPGSDAAKHNARASQEGGDVGGTGQVDRSDAPASKERDSGWASSRTSGAGKEGGEAARKKEGDDEGEDGGDDDDETPVDEDALVSHHMPDLVEELQPMFVKDGADKSSTASKPDATASDSDATCASTKQLASPPVDAAGAAQSSDKQDETAAAVASTSEASGRSAEKGKAAETGGANGKDAAWGGADAMDDTVYYDCFDLKIVYERNKTGFEETKDYPIEINGVIAGRYQILEFLGAAAFSKAVQCVDLTDGSYVCIKIIKNNKDFFDQSLDEIKILKYINAHDTKDDHHLLQLYDYFYFKEHLFIVTELLRDNLYEFSKFNRESGAENYFTMPRLQKITRECLVGLQFVHRLGLIHCDLKPENVLIRSYSRCEIKIIDFGSSCYVTDHLTSYVQSRSYRAPEVILGLPYDQQIDMWSLGCILAELWTGRVLFQNDSLATLLARVVGILGGIEEDLLLQGRYSHRFFTKHKILYDRLSDDDRSLVYIFPKKTSLKHRLATDDTLFVDFVNKLLQVNPAKRFSATEALGHAWLSHDYGQAR